MGLGKAAAVGIIVLFIAGLSGSFYVGQLSNTSVGGSLTTQTVTRTVTQTNSFSGATGQPFKIALFTYTGPTTTWSRAHQVGIREAIAALNSSVRPIKLLENYNVAPPDAEQYMLGLAQQGYNMIIAADVSFEPMVRDLAPKYPQILFLGNAWANTSALPKNVALYGWDIWQGFYPAGMVAAMFSKTGTVCFVAPVDFSITAAAYNVYVLGAKSVNPNIKVLYAFSGDWVDTTKSATAAAGLFSQGCDVGIGMSEAVADGTIREAQREGKLAMGNYFDQWDFANNTVVTSVVWNTTIYWISAIIAAYAGNFGGQYWQFGLKDGIVGIAPFHSFSSQVTPQQQQVLDNFLTNVKSGNITIPYNPTFPQQ